MRADELRVGVLILVAGRYQRVRAVTRVHGWYSITVDSKTLRVKPHRVFTVCPELRGETTRKTPFVVAPRTTRASDPTWRGEDDGARGERVTVRMRAWDLG